MGGDDKCAVWNIRITFAPTITPAHVVEFCKNYTEPKLACYEVGSEKETPHAHIAYVGVPQCRSTVRDRLKKHFPDLSGNASFSLKKQKDDETIHGLYRYICKGTKQEEQPAILYNKDELIDVKTYHEQYWTTQEEFKEEVKKLATKRQDEGIKQKYKVIAELSLTYANVKFSVMTADKITADIIRLYKGNVNDNTLFTALQAIAFNIDPEEAQNQACLRMRAKIFPGY